MEVIASECRVDNQTTFCMCSRRQMALQPEITAGCGTMAAAEINSMCNEVWIWRQFMACIVTAWEAT